MTANTFDLLRRIVAQTRCKPHWSFRLVDEDGALRLVIRVDGCDSFDHGRPFRVDHYHPVPTATFNEKSWRRWIFDQCMRTEAHEVGEHLRFGSGDDECRPFLPTHGPGEDPYAIREYRHEDDAFITQDGSMRDGPGPNGVRRGQDKTISDWADLCAAFIAALPNTWVAYAETAGWDILLVRKHDGVQLGIQAKLRMNSEVLSQAIDQYGHWDSTRSGPDYRAVLVPESNAGFERICAHIGIAILVMHTPPPRGFSRHDDRFSPPLPGTREWHDDRSWYEWCPTQREALPEYVPDVPAGAPSPLQLTDWKIKALKVQATIEARGYVTRADFKHLCLDHRRWIGREGILRQTDPGHWTSADLGFDKQHPRVYAEIKADADKWMLRASQTGTP